MVLMPKYLDACADSGTFENLSPIRMIVMMTILWYIPMLQNVVTLDRNCDGNARLGSIDQKRLHVDSDGDGFGNEDIPLCL